MEIEGLMNKIVDLGCGVMLWVMIMALFGMALLFLFVAAVATTGN